MHSSKAPIITLPGAIIIAGAIIVVAFIWVNRTPTSPHATQIPVGSMPELNMRPVTVNDHILGNPNAKIKIVEYSDPSCPYCKVFHPTMRKIMDEYGASGKVAWVYRHFPFDKPDENGRILHINAGHEAQAMECAASLGGNEKFWAFVNHFYDVTPSVTPQTPNGLDQKKLPTLAKDVGLDPVSFNECLSSGQFKDKVEADYIDGINAGISGTPYSIIITPSGNKVPISGAQPYLTVKTAIDALLAGN